MNTQLYVGIQGCLHMYQPKEMRQIHPGKMHVQYLQFLMEVKDFAQKKKFSLCNVRTTMINISFIKLLAAILA